jgi:hypothetical protein
MPNLKHSENTYFEHVPSLVRQTTMSQTSLAVLIHKSHDRFFH